MVDLILVALFLPQCILMKEEVRAVLFAKAGKIENE